MSRPTIPAPDQIPSRTVLMLEKIGSQFDFVPAMFTTIAVNPTVLDVVVTLQTKTRTLLDANPPYRRARRLQDQPVRLLLGRSHRRHRTGGMSVADLELARAGGSADPRPATAAQFARRVVEARGQLDDADLATVNDAGYSDAEILAIVTLTVQFTLTNYINNVNRTPLDIPTPGRANPATSGDSADRATARPVAPTT